MLEVVEGAGSLQVEVLLLLWVLEVHGYDWLVLYWEALLWVLVPLSVLLPVVEALLHGPCEYMDHLSANTTPWASLLTSPSPTSRLFSLATARSLKEVYSLLFFSMLKCYYTHYAKKCWKIQTRHVIQWWTSH